MLAYATAHIMRVMPPRSLCSFNHLIRLNNFNQSCHCYVRYRENHNNVQAFKKKINYKLTSKYVIVC